MHIPAPEPLVEEASEDMLSSPTPEAIAELLGQLAHIDDVEIEDPAAPELMPARELLRSEWDDPLLFNAIGSRAIGGGGHLPLLDVDGGIYVSKNLGGSKAVLYPSQEGIFDVKSDLPDILEEYHGITMTVREVQRLGHRGTMTGERELSGNRVATVTLKSRAERTFAGFDSSTSGHGHLYIQRLFTDGDYSELVSAFTKMGILSERWQEIVASEGQGILRTPWSTKPLDSYSS
jgi:hypothetical protein